MISLSGRDLLLLLQLLHARGLLEAGSVREDNPRLGDVGAEWWAHKSTQLSVQQGELARHTAPTPREIVATYQQLLADNPECRGTTELANKVYYERMATVEEKLRRKTEEFRGELAAYRTGAD
jgi:hypothetical protein